jgi:hypothetical protein
MSPYNRGETGVIEFNIARLEWLVETDVHIVTGVANVNILLEVKRLFAHLELATSLALSTATVSAQNLSWDTWAPYRDRFGLIDSVLVDKTTRDPSTNNGLLYTAEACVIMQLRGVTFDRNAIASAIASCEVKPGLFRRSPTNPQDQEGPDDYFGLGALAGVCGFHDIARDILEYGKSSGKPPFNYNYNNIDPGKFTTGSWMGRFPAIIIHWKIAAGEQPTTADFTVWSGALEVSARNNMKTDSPQDPWLQSWLMVLTYQTSGIHSIIADAAVKNWWSLLHQRWPGGIKQAMVTYLAGGAQGNPLGDYIEDFQNAGVSR